VTCKHCGRGIIQNSEGVWVDPEATGDDSLWRETCDSHDTFIADHEPAAAMEQWERDWISGADEWEGQMARYPGVVSDLAAFEVLDVEGPEAFLRWYEGLNR
jgi:hypothetical protein